MATTILNPFESIERQLELINAKLDVMAGSPRSEKWLTVRGAAEFTGYSPHTIYKLKAERDIPFHQRGGKILFRESELSEWLKEKSD